MKHTSMFVILAVLSATTLIAYAGNFLANANQVESPPLVVAKAIDCVGCSDKGPGYDPSNPPEKDRFDRQTNALIEAERLERLERGKKAREERLKWKGCVVRLSPGVPLIDSPELSRLIESLKDDRLIPTNRARMYQGLVNSRIPGLKIVMWDVSVSSQKVLPDGSTEFRVCISPALEHPDQGPLFVDSFGHLDETWVINLGGEIACTSVRPKWIEHQRNTPGFNEENAIANGPGVWQN